jgi:putative endonuclease
MTNKYNTVLYVGVTNNLQQRVLQHKNRISNFTTRYNVTKVIYWEEFSDIRNAIAREKQIKSWSRERKERLINEINPEWRDLMP